MRKRKMPPLKFAEDFAIHGNCNRCDSSFDERHRGNLIKGVAFCPNCVTWAMTRPKDVDQRQLLEDLLPGGAGDRRRRVIRPHPHRRKTDDASGYDPVHHDGPGH